MRHAVISFSFAASLTLGCAGALAQAGGGASGGSSAGLGARQEAGHLAALGLPPA
jgi:hypothetical protein